MIFSKNKLGIGFIIAIALLLIAMVGFVMFA